MAVNLSATECKGYVKILRVYHDRHGFFPTLRELAEVLECSHKMADDYLVTLEQKGFIKREAGKARAIKILKG